jgi:hypothetical protein
MSPKRIEPSFYKNTFALLHLFIIPLHLCDIFFNREELLNLLLA